MAELPKIKNIRIRQLPSDSIGVNSYRAVIIVKNDENDFVDSIEIQIEPASIESPKPQNTIVICSFKAENSQKNKKRYVNDQIVFLGDALDSDYKVKAIMKEKDGTPIGFPINMSVVVEDRDDDDMIYYDASYSTPSLEINDSEISMIKKIRIKNFKSIVDINIELGRVNVFIGENGCGKTNILEAITFGSVAAETERGGTIDSLLGLRGVRVTDPHLMKSAFDGSSKKEVYKNMISMSNQMITDVWFFNERNEEFDVRILNRNNDSWTAAFRMGLTKETREYVEKNNHIRNKAGIPTPKYKPYLTKVFGENTINTFLNYSPENFFLRKFEEEGQIKPLGIRGEGLFKHIVELYKRNPQLLSIIGENLRLIGWFKDFQIPNDLMFTEQRINIKDKYLQEIDFFDQRSANEGFLYLLFYFTLFVSPYTPNFFSIDNIDNALNPKLCAELIRRLVKLSSNNSKQVILTTHNPAILDGLDLEDDSQRLFTVYRNINGHTIIKRVLPPKKIEGIEPIRLSEAYIRGYLGGLPKNF